MSPNIKLEVIDPNKEPQKAKAAGISYAPAVVLTTGNSVPDFLM